MVEVEMVLDHLADFFRYTLIMSLLALVLHVGEAITIGALTKMDPLVSRVLFKTPLALLVSCFFIIPPICKCIRCPLGLRAFLNGYLSWNILDNWWGDMVICISSLRLPGYVF